MALSNLPNEKTKSSSDATLKVFDQYYQSPIELNNLSLVAMTGFFEERGFSAGAAEATAVTLLVQAKKDNINPMQIMDTLKGLGNVEISALISEILNYNRFKSSAIGTAQLNTPTPLVLRNIEQKGGRSIFIPETPSSPINPGPIPQITPVHTAIPFYRVLPDHTVILEGESIGFTIIAEGMPDGTTLYWSIEGTNVTETDFTDTKISASIIINGGYAQLSKTAALDGITEGTETFVMNLRAGSVTGDILATSVPITILDFVLSGTGTKLQSPTAGMPNVIFPVVVDGWTLSALGAPSAPNTSHVIANGYIEYTINGGGTGAIGAGQGPGYLTGIGLRFDPTNTGNYGVDDYIQPGTPWEGFGFIINNAYSIIGSNSGYGNIVGTDMSTPASTWTLSANNVLVKIGDPTIGIGICQYLSLPNEPIIRMLMSFTNTTLNPMNVKMMRGVDPDVDLLQYGTYDSLNIRGLPGVSVNDVVTSVGLHSGKPLTLYAPGNGYTHNTAIISDWPTFLVDLILGGRDDSGVNDYAILAGWDCGTVQPGATVYVGAYYLCSTSAADVLALI